VPLARALRSRRPVHVRVAITGLDGSTRLLEVSAFPLEGQGQQLLGAVALFWESPVEGG
jgi:hypothetical protein